MNIKTKSCYVASTGTFEIESFVENELQGRFASGQVETLKEEHTNLLRAFARLIDTLAERGSLNAGEVVHIAGGVDFVESAELQPTEP